MSPLGMKKYPKQVFNRWANVAKPWQREGGNGGLTSKERAEGRREDGQPKWQSPVKTVKVGDVRYSIFSCVHFSSANPLQEPLPRSTLQPHLFLWPPPAPGPQLPDIKHRCWHLSHHCCPDHHQASESLPLGKRVKEKTDFSASIPGTSAWPLKKIDFPDTGDGPRGGAPWNAECLHSLAVTPCPQGSTLTGPQQQCYHSLHMLIADQLPSLCCFLPSWTFSNWPVSASCHRWQKIHVCELHHLSLGQPALEAG